MPSQAGLLWPDGDMDPTTLATFREYLRQTRGDVASAATLTLADALQRGLDGQASTVVEPAPTMPADVATVELLSLKEAAAYLGYTERGLRKIVGRSWLARRGRIVNAPTIEFSQAGKRGAIRFRREWLDDFINKGRVMPIPDLPLATRRRTYRGKSHGLDYGLLTQ